MKSQWILTSITYCRVTLGGIYGHVHIVLREPWKNVNLSSEFQRAAYVIWSIFHVTEMKRPKYILGSGQFLNYTNVKQSATKIAFKHQLQSGPLLTKINTNTFNSHAFDKQIAGVAYPVI